MPYSPFLTLPYLSLSMQKFSYSLLMSHVLVFVPVTEGGSRRAVVGIAVSVVSEKSSAL
jgi:hypothetical protein